MSLANPILTAENVSVYHHGKKSAAITNADFQIVAGSCVALLGPNGAGKSTLLRALAGLSMGHVTGSIILFGRAIDSLSARELARQRAFVPQDNSMPFAFSVREAVSLAVTAPNLSDSVEAALSRFDLVHLAERSVVTLSGGERQRVAIARAFAQDTPLLLLDEPTAHQDLRYSGHVLQAVRAFVREELSKRVAVAVLHDLNLARDWADTVLLLKNGRLHAHGSSEEVLTAETLAEVYETPIVTTPFIRAIP